MEKVCSGLSQLVTATDTTSHYFRSMVLVTLTHVFIELDMLRAHPAAFEAFVEIILGTSLGVRAVLKAIWLLVMHI